MTDLSTPSAPQEEQRSTSRSILKDASRYTAATYAAQVGGFAVGLATKGLLGPTNVGIWALLNILLGYLAASAVGTTDAIAKEVPYLREKGDSTRAQSLIEAMLGFVLGVSAAVGLVVAGIAVLRPQLDLPYRVGVLLVGLIFPLWMFMNAQTVLLRAAKRFDALSTQLILQLLVTAAVGVPLIWRFSIYGQYTSFVVLVVVVALYFSRVMRRDTAFVLRPRLNWLPLRQLFAIGIPLQLASLVTTVQTTADSLLAAKVLGVTSLGYYSLAVTVKGYIYQTPNAFSVVMFPRFQERFAASRDDPAALRTYVEKPILGFALVILPILIGASWQVVPFVVRHFLPAFIPAVPAIRLLLVGTFFTSLWHMPVQFLIAVNKLWQGVLIAGVNACLVVGAVLVATRMHPSVASVAIGTSVAYALGFLLMTGYVLRHFASVLRVTLFLGEILLAGAVLFGALLAADSLIGDAAAIPADSVRLVLRLVVLLLPAAVLLRRADRVLGLRQYLRWGREAAA